jgi:hypothetical protein
MKQGVERVHPDFEKIQDQWKRCRDAIDGEDAIKAAGVRYLPRPSGHDDAQYAAYVNRAYWYNATERALDGFHGMIFKKDPVIDVPPAIESYIDTIDVLGNSFQTFAQLVVKEVLSVGRVGILVDFPRVDFTEVGNQAEFERLGLRPYTVLFRAENITNWRTEIVNGRRTLTMVVLYTPYERPTDDPFYYEVVPSYRVLRLVDGVYTIDQWDRVDKAYVLVDSNVPRVNGRPWTEIPFQFINADHLLPDICKPPLINLINLNVALYRTTADLENGAHWTGVPTAVISGLSPDQNEVVLGAEEALILPIGGEASFLEFTGSGLAALEQRGQVKEQEMARIALRILATDKKAAEAADTEAIRREGENSVLASIAYRTGRGLSNVMNYICAWVNAPGEAVVELNTEYSATSIDAQLLTAYLNGWQTGAYTHRDLFRLLQRAGIIDEDRVFEDLKDEVDDENPLSGALIGDNQ